MTYALRRCRKRLKIQAFWCGMFSYVRGEMVPGTESTFNCNHLLEHS
jgi:hypothetical protein